ncbi:MAG: hypothetical protein JWO80_6486 [Bryobacterales bacterium]|nr:hypothetical protein [Bryobacterales bacterium]
MLIRQKLIFSVALVIFAAAASGSPFAYVVNGNQFGTIDLVSGAFLQIGPNTPEGESGLAPGPNGSLLTLTFSGNLDSINPITGATALIGPTGLTDCSTPTSPCGPTSPNMLGEMGGTIYATDFDNNLYEVNPLTGATTLIGHTGIPAISFIPLTTNPDGSFNFYDESLFGAGVQLYATFDTGTFNPVTSTPTAMIAPNLYRIDPSTGLATLIGPTALGLGAVVGVNGTFYGFDDATGQVVTLDLTNGHTSFVSNFDPAAGIIDGASPVPEPASIALAGIGIAAMIVAGRRGRRAPRF